MILGIDEVGRGPWAGPLVVGAVVLGGAKIEGLDDSKKLTKKKREALDEIIREHADAVGLGWVTAAELDEIGMSDALRLATRRAVEQIKAPYTEIVIDGTINFLSDTGKGPYVTTLAKADALIPSVSAASIVAKVARDAYMTAQDEIYPGYGFAGHAGYGVAKHREAIEKLGVTPLHRLSFAPLQKYRIEGRVQADLPPKRLRARILSITNRDNTGLQMLQKETAFAQSTRATGNQSETVATGYLVRKGHTIIERNWRTRWCEVDIISRHGDIYYFTEVKHRKVDTQGDGLAAITATKQRQMSLAARMYVHLHEDARGYDLQLAAIATTGIPPSVTEFLEIV
ncbi:MAG: ribonuclease HII [Candidatus Saccharimonas sp.]